MCILFVSICAHMADSQDGPINALSEIVRQRNADHLKQTTEALRFAVTDNNFHGEHFGTHGMFNETGSILFWTLMIQEYFHIHDTETPNSAPHYVANTAPMSMNIHNVILDQPSFKTWMRHLNTIMPDYDNCNRLPCIIAQCRIVVGELTRPKNAVIKQLYNTDLLVSSEYPRYKPALNLFNANSVDAVNLRIRVQKRPDANGATGKYHVMSVVIKRVRSGTQQRVVAYVIDAGCAMSALSGVDDYDTENTQVVFALGLLHLESYLLVYNGLVVHEFNFQNAYMWIGESLNAVLSTQIIAASIAFDWPVSYESGMHPSDEMVNVIEHLELVASTCVNHEACWPRETRGPDSYSITDEALETMAKHMIGCTQRSIEHDSGLYKLVYSLFKVENRSAAQIEVQRQRTERIHALSPSALLLRDQQKRAAKLSEQSEFQNSAIDTNVLLATVNDTDMFNDMVILYRRINKNVYCRKYIDPEVNYLGCDTFLYWVLIAFENKYLSVHCGDNTKFPGFIVCPTINVRTVIIDEHREKGYPALQIWLKHHESHGLEKIGTTNRLQSLLVIIRKIVDAGIHDQTFPGLMLFMYHQQINLIRTTLSKVLDSALQRISRHEVDSLVIPVAIKPPEPNLGGHAISIVLKRNVSGSNDVTAFVIDTSTFVSSSAFPFNNLEFQPLLILAMIKIEKYCADKITIAKWDFTHTFQWQQSQGSCNLVSNVISTAVVFDWPMEYTGHFKFSDDSLHDIVNHMSSVVRECVVVNNPSRKVIDRNERYNLPGEVLGQDPRCNKFGEFHHADESEAELVVKHIIECTQTSMSTGSGLLPLVRHIFDTPDKYAPNRVDREHKLITGKRPVDGAWKRHHTDVMARHTAERLVDSASSRKRKAEKRQRDIEADNSS